MIPYRMNPMGFAGLPYKRKLEYLQSHGNNYPNSSKVGEYIDTGWYFPSDAQSFRIEAKLCFVSANTHTALWPVACGANNSNGGGTLQYYKIQGYPLNITRIVYGNADAAQNLYDTSVPNTAVDPYMPFTTDMQYSNGTTTIYTNGGNMLSWTEAIDYRGTTTCWLFSLNTGNGATFAVDMRLYYFRITQDGTVVRDFIPVLDRNDSPCLYDKAGKKFYYNLAQNAIGFIPGY